MLLNATAEVSETSTRALHFLTTLLNSMMSRRQAHIHDCCMRTLHVTTIPIVYNLSIQGLLSDATFLQTTVVITRFAVQPLRQDGYKRSRRNTLQRLMASIHSSASFIKIVLLYLNCRNLSPLVTIQKQQHVLRFSAYTKRSLVEKWSSRTYDVSILISLHNGLSLHKHYSDRSTQTTAAFSLARCLCCLEVWTLVAVCPV